MSFDFKKINILIGDQGTGKSTVAKLLSAINKMASGETLAAGKVGLMLKDEYGKLNHFKRHLKIYGIENYLNKLTTIFYKHPLFDFNYSEGDCNIIKTNKD